jgi:hypothetical protein
MKTKKLQLVKFIIGFIVGLLLYFFTNSILFLIPLMLGIITYNAFLSRYFNHFKI